MTVLISKISLKTYFWFGIVVIVNYKLIICFLLFFIIKKNSKKVEIKKKISKLTLVLINWIINKVIHSNNISSFTNENY